MTHLAVSLVWYFATGAFTAWLVCIPGGLVNDDGSMRAPPGWFELTAIVALWWGFCGWWFVKSIRR